MSEIPDHDAWHQSLEALDRLSDRMVDLLGLPTDDGLADEAYVHLAQQLTCWMTWAVSHADPAEPRFQRQNDFATPWGGPNADNVYRHTRISPDHTYRISGRMHSCEDLAVAIREGFRHTDRPATLAELTASEVGIGPGDDFELLLGGSGSEPNRIPLPEGAIMCSIREYYMDWQAEEPATFTVTRLDGDPAPPPPLPDRLAEAVDLCERSVVFWHRYMEEARARQRDNAFGDRVDVPRGLKLSKFGFCFFDLGPDEALVLECEVPDARYWSFQLYGMHFFRPLDLARTTSLNNAQLHLGDDGRVRLVVAPRDPGVPNWLDTEGRRRALVNYRHFWGGAMPAIATSVVPVGEVRDALPSSTPTVSPADRADEVAARRRHLAWRFRT